jgi:hypothetical protein
MERGGRPYLGVVFSQFHDRLVTANFVVYFVDLLLLLFEFSLPEHPMAAQSIGSVATTQDFRHARQGTRLAEDATLHFGTTLEHLREKIDAPKELKRRQNKDL